MMCHTHNMIQDFVHPLIILDLILHPLDLTPHPLDLMPHLLNLMPHLDLMAHHGHAHFSAHHSHHPLTLVLVIVFLLRPVIDHTPIAHLLQKAGRFINLQVLIVRDHITLMMATVLFHHGAAGLTKRHQNQIFLQSGVELRRILI